MDELVNIPALHHVFDGVTRGERFGVYWYGRRWLLDGAEANPRAEFWRLAGGKASADPTELDALTRKTSRVKRDATVP